MIGRSKFVTMLAYMGISERPNLTGTALCSGPNEITLNPPVGLPLEINTENTLVTSCGNFNPITRGCLPAERANVPNPACVVFSLAKVESAEEKEKPIILTRTIPNIGEITLKPQIGQVQIGDRIRELSLKEAKILAVLMKEEKEYLSAEEIHKKAVGEISGDRSAHISAIHIINTYISFLRKHLGDTKDDKGKFKIIRGKRGRGYCLTNPQLAE